MLNINGIVHKYSHSKWEDLFSKDNPEQMIKDIMGIHASKCDCSELCKGFTEMKWKHERATFVIKAFQQNNYSKSALDAKIIRKFLFLVCDRIVPLLFFGGMTQKRKFKLFIGQLPLKGFNETIFINRLVKTCDFSTFTWISVKEADERGLIYQRLITWLLQKYFFNMIKNIFFVCKLVKSNKLVYYWKLVWLQRERAAFQKLRSKCNVENISKDELLSKGFLCSRLQFRAKKNGLRPIMIDYPVRRELPASGVDENSITKTARQFLQKLFKKEENSSPVKRGKKFLDLWKENISFLREKKHHFIKFDVRDAFGSVKHDIMEDILKVLFRKYVQQNSMIYIKTVEEGKRQQMFFDVLDEDFNSQTGHIEFLQAELLLGVIVKSFRFQVFCWRRKTFTLRTGLVQGRRLSPSLCDLYLHAMEMHFLQPFCKGRNLLIREMDDYLYITPSHDDAARFYRFFKRGFDLYGIRVNMKTQDSDTNPRISFVGYEIDSVKMEIRLDLPKYCDVDLTHRLNLRCKTTTLPKKLIKHKIATTCRVPERLVNSDFNSYETRVETLYFCGSLQAARMHGMIMHTMRGEECSKLVISCGKICAAENERRVQKHFPIQIGSYVTLRAFEDILRKNVSKYYGPIKFFQNAQKSLEKKFPDCATVNAVIKNIRSTNFDGLSQQ